MEKALAFTQELREQPNCTLINPDPRHWEIFSKLCRIGGIKGNRVPDAFLAALAVESGSDMDLDGSRLPSIPRPACAPSLGITTRHIHGDLGQNLPEKGIFSSAATTTPMIRSTHSPMTNIQERVSFTKTLSKPAMHNTRSDPYVFRKQWRGIATRYAKNVSSFLAAIQFRAALCGAEFDDTLYETSNFHWRPPWYLDINRYQLGK